MRTRRDFVLWLSALSAAGFARPLAADSATEESAERAAREWLALADAGGYGECWEAAGPMLRKAVRKAQWVEALEKTRGPLGAARPRTVVSRRLVDSPPGAPRGAFLVLRYTTDFEEKPGTVETVTESRGRDGSWRVSGYFIE